MKSEGIEINGKIITLENVTLEDIEQIFEFDRDVLLKHRLKLSQEYMNTHFPENEKLFKRLQKSIKKNIELTDPKTFKSPSGVMTYRQLVSKDFVDENNKLEEKKYVRRKNLVKNLFKKPERKKSLVDEKLNHLNNEMKKTGML